jgi:glycosyltransferase involved in cell wall biosynthesis
VSFLPRDSVRAELGLAGSVLLYAGRLEPVKGPDVLLEAFAEIRVALPDATLVVAGEGSLASELRARVAERPLPGVRFLGQRSDIPDLIAAADLVVLPSRGEGMPTLLLEALLAGRAVVATRVGAVADVTEDGRFARIVPPGDAATLARACIALLRDSAARQRLAEGAPAAVRRRFDPALAAAATEALYLEALGALRQGPGQKLSHEPPSP